MTERSVVADGTRGGPQHIPRPADARPGDPPPWYGLPRHRLRPDVDDVRAAFVSPRPPRPSPVERLETRPAAVLAVVYPAPDGARIVLTRRAWHLRSHRGEVSFPGGSQDPGESLWETALREAWEEVGLEPSGVEHLGELDHLSTITSRSFIVPYVAALSDGPPALAASPDEVEAVLHVPLAELLRPGVYRQERWGFGGQDRPIHFFELDGDTVWGATGAMLVDLLRRVTGT